MLRSFRVSGMATVAMAALLAGPAGAQEKKDAPPSAADMPISKPGPEHELLKGDAGVWDATVELKMAPDGKPEVTKGVETNTVIGGGLWLVQDFKGEFMGQSYEGHTVTGYDQHRKKYVGTWVDSMASGLATIEGTFDGKTRTLTAKVEGACPDGTQMKTRATTEYRGDGTRVFTMYSPPEMGPEFAIMTITYKRRAGTAAR